MRKFTTLLLLLPLFCTAQRLKETLVEKSEVFPFLGTYYNMYVANRMPYTDIFCEAGHQFKLKGTFVVDYGTDTTAVDLSGFPGAFLYQPDDKGLSLTFVNGTLTSGPHRPRSFYLQHYDNLMANGIRQAGIVGTDILSQLTITLDYAYSRLYIVWKQDAQCLPDTMSRRGFVPASTEHFFSNDRRKITTKDSSNNPTVPIVIGDGVDSAKAFALIDPGFDDKFNLNDDLNTYYTHAININQLYFDHLQKKGLGITVDKKKFYTLSNRTPIPDTVYLCKFPRRYVFNVIGIKGEVIMPYGTDECSVFLKINGKGGASAGGITTLTFPAAQFGGSFLMDCEQITFDPFRSLVWIRTIRPFKK